MRWVTVEGQRFQTRLTDEEIAAYLRAPLEEGENLVIWRAVLRRLLQDLNLRPEGNYNSRWAHDTALIFAGGPEMHWLYDKAGLEFTRDPAKVAGGLQGLIL